AGERWDSVCQLGTGPEGGRHHLHSRWQAIMRAIGMALGILGVCRAAADGQVSSPKAGVGMAFIIASPAGQLAGFFNLFVPLNLGSHFRLEPQLGWRTTSFPEGASDPAAPANRVSGSSRVLLLGVGLLGTQRPGDGATILYYGPRIGLEWTAH